MPALAENLPREADYINDFANLLDEPQRAELDHLARDVERKTTVELAVVTVTSLEGMTVEKNANALFEQWKIGKKGKDNGVLILVAAR